MDKIDLETIARQLIPAAMLALALLILFPGGLEWVRSFAEWGSLLVGSLGLLACLGVGLAIHSFGQLGGLEQMWGWDNKGRPVHTILWYARCWSCRHNTRRSGPATEQAERRSKPDLAPEEPKLTGRVFRGWSSFNQMVAAFGRRYFACSSEALTPCQWQERKCDDLHTLNLIKRDLPLDRIVDALKRHLPHFLNSNADQDPFFVIMEIETLLSRKGRLEAVRADYNQQVMARGMLTVALILFWIGVASIVVILGMAAWDLAWDGMGFGALWGVYGSTFLQLLAMPLLGLIGMICFANAMRRFANFYAMKLFNEFISL